MRKCFILIGIMALLPLVVMSQSTADDVVFTGTLLDVTGYVDSNSGKDKVSFDLRLYLQIHNNGTEQLILFRPDRFIGQKKIEFFRTSGALGAAKTIPWLNPFANLDFDPLPSYIRKLAAAPEPDLEGFVIIPPGGYFEFRDTVTVDTGYEADRRQMAFVKKFAAESGTNSRIAVAGTPTSEFPALSIEYSLSLKTHHEDPDFLKVLQTRWAAFGKLYLNGNGDFSIKTQTIINRIGH